MPIHGLRRTLALLTAAALLATLTAATVASPVSAAKPKCQGKTATIVGTKKNDIIRGTAKRDIIVAKGGNDRIYAKGGNDLICAGPGNDRVFGGPGADTIWGQLGRDTLNGNAGPDFVAGQVGNDTLNGGIGVDTCFQGTGTGAVSNCERPAPAPPPAAPAPPAPTPTTPAPPPPAKLLAIAYSDLDGDDAFGAGDVMIAKLVDTNGDTVVSTGDTITMGRYPKVQTPGPGDFGEWGIKTHTVETVKEAGSNRIVVDNSDGGEHQWWVMWSEYRETAGTEQSDIYDYGGAAGDPDIIWLKQGSPSQPVAPPPAQFPTGAGDHDFIDVEIYVP